MSIQSKKAVLLTGASGKVGRQLRTLLRNDFELRCTDIVESDNSDADGYTHICDLSDFDSIRAVSKGVSAVVHLAAIPRDAPIEEIAKSNLVATYNVYEACRINGIKRVIFGSTNHVVGFYHTEQQIDSSSMYRPDGLYGASKVFGEALASLYWDKHGIETVVIRIGSVLEQPTQNRHLSTWISHRDLAHLVMCSLITPRVGLTTVYGVSHTSYGWWNNQNAKHLGYAPKDSSDDFADEVRNQDSTNEDIMNPEYAFQGGRWAAKGYDR